MRVAELLASVLPSVLVVITALFALGKWVSRIEQAGRDIQSNTEATKHLTSAFEAHSEKIGNEVNDHEVRIRILEVDSKRTNPTPVVIQPVPYSSTRQ